MSGRDEDRDRRADARDAAADERDRTADARDRAADARDTTADERDRTATARDAAADLRERALDAREERLVRRIKDLTDPASRAESRAFSQGLLDRSAEAIARGRALLSRADAEDDRRTLRAVREQSEVDAEIRKSGERPRPEG